MVKGEYVSMNALHDAAPDLAPRAIAYETYASDPKLHFILLPYIPMTDENPTFDLVPALIHLHSSSTSPNGKFGFSHPTLKYQFVEWTDTWEEFFTNSLRKVQEKERNVQGYDAELAELQRKTFELVIPRLLRPLETGGRKVKPCLLHGDLWEGNTSTETVRDKPVFFDAASYYGHNEGKSPSPGSNLCDGNVG